METKLGLMRRDFRHHTGKTFSYLYEDSNFSDVTLVSKDHKHIKAHKAILSAGSQFFHELLLRNPHPHPLVYLQVSSEELASMVSFLYLGECQVRPQDIDQFLDIARGFKIEGIVSEKHDTETSLVSPLPVENYTKPITADNPISMEELLKKKGIYETGSEKCVSETNSSEPAHKINSGVQRAENDESEAISGDSIDIIKQGERSEDNDFLEEIMECLPAIKAAPKDECALQEGEQDPQLALSGSQLQSKYTVVTKRTQDEPATTEILGLRLQVLATDGRQSDINDVATARVLLNRHLRHSPPPLLPGPLSKIAMDTKKVKTVLRTLWKHEGFAWGNNSSYYDFMDVSIPIESFSRQTKHVLRKESNPTVKLSDVIQVMEDPSLKPKLSKK